MPSMELEVIDLAKAKAYLDKNHLFERGVEDSNRPVSIKRINDYALEMLRGNWMLTGQAIAFDTKGWLKDGQHRLMAFVQACEIGAIDGDEVVEANPKLTIKFYVARGLDKNIFKVLDTGLSRSGGQILAMSGHANVTHLASAARVIYLYDNHDFKFWRRIKVTNKQILEVVEGSKLEEYLPVGVSLYGTGIIVSAATAANYLCVRNYPEGPHEEFLEGLREGADLASDSPILALRNNMMRSKTTNRVRRETYSHAALYIKGWNDFAAGRRRTLLSFRQGEQFPDPITKEQIN